MKSLYSPYVKKIAVWLVVAIVIIIISNQALKLITKIRAAKDEWAIKRDIEASNLTYDLAQYSIQADKLEESIGAWSTDEDAVYNVFRKMKNNDDVKQLNKAFGERLFTYLKGKLALGAYMQAGMSNSEIEEVNKIMSNNGITISF